jgi:hypothetical protein
MDKEVIWLVSGVLTAIPVVGAVGYWLLKEYFKLKEELERERDARLKEMVHTLAERLSTEMTAVRRDLAAQSAHFDKQIRDLYEQFRSLKAAIERHSEQIKAQAEAMIRHYRHFAGALERIAKSRVTEIAPDTFRVSETQEKK